MLNHQQPLTLRDMGIRKFREMLNDVMGSWIRMLVLAGDIGIYNYSKQLEEVRNKCKTLNEFLALLPREILEDIIPPLLPNFLNKISAYNTTFRKMKRIRRHPEIERKHEDVCVEMLKSVLGPFTRRYNTELMSSFEQRLIIQTFISTPNLSHLMFSTAPEIDNSSLLARNIHHLKNLVSFQYNDMCTDQVIQQLALHCSKVRIIDVSNSPAVTDVSVHHLLKLKVLIHVDLTGTSVTERN